LVADHLTIADLVVSFSLILPFQVALDGGFRKAMGNISGLVDRVVHLPEVVKRLGNVKFAAKIIKPQVPKKEEKKEAPKAAKKEAAHGGDDDEEKPVKKEANPLDVLPPTTFDLYAFKTFFVNH